MLFKTYKVKQGQWGGVIDSTITIPEGLKLITGGPHSIGPFIHEGNLHYLGIIEADIDEVSKGLEGLHVTAEKFDKYVFITIHDIQFIEDYPYLVPADELNNEFNLKDYYVITWSKDLQLMNMKRIMRIDSEFDIKVQVVTNTDYIGKSPYKSLLKDSQELNIILDKHFSFSDSAPFPAMVVKGEIADAYWKTLVNKVVEGFGPEMPNFKIVNLEKPQQIYHSMNFGTLDNYLKMKEVEYLWS